MPLGPGHASALATAAAESSDAYRYIPVPQGLEETRSYVGHALAQKDSGARCPFAIRWRGRWVGTTSYYDFQPWLWPAVASCAPSDGPDSTEVGYTWLAASAQRTSCNTEAKLLLFSHAFEKWSVRSVALRTDARIGRSRAAIERLGCKFEGIRRAHMPASDGEVRDSAYYSVIAGEWPSVRARITRLLQRREAQ